MRLDNFRQMTDTHQSEKPSIDEVVRKQGEAADKLFKRTPHQKKPVNVIVTDPKTGAIKADGVKNRLELLPFGAIEDVGDVLTYGAAKYADRNWEKGLGWSRVYGATLRHIFQWWKGVDTDPESGLPHLAHAACNILFLLHYSKHNTDMDDRPHRS